MQNWNYNLCQFFGTAQHCGKDISVTRSSFFYTKLRVWSINIGLTAPYLQYSIEELHQCIQYVVCHWIWNEKQQHQHALYNYLFATNKGYYLPLPFQQQKLINRRIVQRPNTPAPKNRPALWPYNYLTSKAWGGKRHRSMGKLFFFSLIFSSYTTLISWIPFSKVQSSRCKKGASAKGCSWN